MRQENLNPEVEAAAQAARASANKAWWANAGASQAASSAQDAVKYHLTRQDEGTALVLEAACEESGKAARLASRASDRAHFEARAAARSICPKAARACAARAELDSAQVLSLEKIAIEGKESIWQVTDSLSRQVSAEFDALTAAKAEAEPPAQG